MHIEYFSDYLAMSERACVLILQQIEENPQTLLCPATGNTPLKTYQLLAQKLLEKPTELRLLMLDEWYGLDKTQEGSCYAFLRKYLVEPLQIPNERFFIYDSQTSNPEGACLRMQVCLKQEGPIDLMILGIGLNGHLGFNEPNDFLSPACHVAELEEQTKQHTMIGELSIKPTKGLTLGMGEILQAKKIILLINGAHKKEIIKAFLKGEISTHLPASFLWLHPNVTCLIEANAL